MKEEKRNNNHCLPIELFRLRNNSQVDQDASDEDGKDWDIYRENVCFLAQNEKMNM